MKILLIGSGGREHALAWKLKQSPNCSELICAPGNAGMEEVARCVDIGVDDIDAIVSFVTENNIEFVVVGPENPLCDGLADAIQAVNVPVFGPSKAAAALEGSKGFMKDVCTKHNIPTAAYGRFDDVESAVAFIEKQGAPIVVKADGLAAGKGVIIAETQEDAMTAVKDMLSGNAFGAAGAQVVIEEFMDGEELSFFALCDGETVVPMTSAQDHKRVGDGDTGLNTGGMGAYSPAHLMTDELYDKIMDRIILPTAQGMAADGAPFAGVFFAGLMVVNGEPKLIEYNVRFGDPECQAMMVRLQDDMVDVLYATATGELQKYKSGLKWSGDTALCVVMAANGYPESYAKNTPLQNIEDACAQEHVDVFHAGTKRFETGEIVNVGGRVLNVVATGNSVSQAQERAYQAVDKVKWPDGFCRRDIGWRAILAEEQKLSKAS